MSSYNASIKGLSTLWSNLVVHISTLVLPGALTVTTDSPAISLTSPSFHLVFDLID